MEIFSLLVRYMLRLLSLLLTIYFYSVSACAFSYTPIMAIGTGTFTSSTIGQSTHFPIQDATTDQFYNYSANKPTQTGGIVDGFLGVEWSLSPTLLLQTGIDCSQTSSFSAKGTLTQGADTPSADTYGYRYHVSITKFLLEGKLLSTINNRYHPYLLAGVGMAFNETYGYETNAPTHLILTREYANNTTSTLSYAFGLGIDYDITPQLRAGIGYRFSDAGEVRLGKATIDNTPVSGTLSQPHLYSNEVVVQLTWMIT